MVKYSIKNEWKHSSLPMRLDAKHLVTASYCICDSC